MNSEEQLKQQLNDILSRKQFAFEQAQWEKMDAMLSARKRRRAAFILFTAGLLLLGGALYFFDTNTSDKVVAQHEQIVQQAAQTETSAKSISRNAPAAQENSVVNPSPETSQPATTRSLPADKTSSQPVKQDKVHAPEISQPVKTSEPADLHNTAGPAKPTIPAKQPVVNQFADTKTPSEPVPGKQPVNEIDIPSQHPVEPASNNGSTTEVQPATVPLIAAGTSSPAIAPATALPVSQTTEQVMEKKPAETAVEEKSIPVNSLAVIPPVKPDSVASAVVMKPDTDYVRTKKLFLVPEAGTFFGFGWKETNGREATGFNPALGVNLSYLMKGGLELNAGIHYNMSGYLKAGNYTATVTRLDLGVYSKVTVYTPVRLHYVSVTIRIYRHVNEKTAYGVGLTTSYLLTADSKVEQYDYSSAGGQTNYKTWKDKGYTQGFSNYDLQFALLAKRNLYRNLWLQGELLVGLKDVKTGAFIPSEGTERNSGIRMTIQYKLFTK